VRGTKRLRDKDGLHICIAENKFAQVDLRGQPTRMLEVIVDHRTDGSEAKRSNRMRSLGLALEPSVGKRRRTGQRFSCSGRTGAQRGTEPDLRQAYYYMVNSDKCCASATESLEKLDPSIGFTSSVSRLRRTLCKLCCSIRRLATRFGGHDL
jgi:hypothetical protein